MPDDTHESSGLPNCDMRQSLSSGHFYCRHESVRSNNRVVSAAVCKHCEFRAVSSGAPYPLVPVGTSARDLPVEVKKRLSCRKVTKTLPELRQEIARLVTLASISIEGQTESLRRSLASVRERYDDMTLLVASDAYGPTASNLSSASVVLLGQRCPIRALVALENRCTTEFLLLIPPGLSFASETPLERLLDVMQDDREIGIVGGLIECDPGQAMRLCLGELDVFRGRVRLVPPCRAVQSTNQGTNFRYVDVVQDFALFRCAAVRDFVSAPHTARFSFFEAIKRAALWRVAVCPQVTGVLPSSETTSPALSPNLLSNPPRPTFSIQRNEPQQSENADPAKVCSGKTPNLLIFGVAHSGTTIVTRMLGHLGWQTCESQSDMDWRYWEHVKIRQLNISAWKTGKLDQLVAMEQLSRIPMPWIIKDPRFVDTLWLWASVLRQYDPLIVWLTRDVASVKASYRKRQGISVDQQPLSRGATIEQRFQTAKESFDIWPFSKVQIAFEDIAQAISGFSLQRAGFSSD